MLEPVFSHSWAAVESK